MLLNTRKILIYGCLVLISMTLELTRILSLATFLVLRSMLVWLEKQAKEE